MREVTMEQLLREHASAKKKMVLGIVFTAIAFFLCYMGMIMVNIGTAEAAAAVMIVLSLPAWGVGLPFLIIGIINTIKSNRRINLAKAQPYAAPVAPAPVASAPVAAPVAAPVVEAPVTAPVVEEAPAQAETAGSAAELDWRKYNPLDAGVSINLDKDYKFHRADGFVGSVPQKFVDRTFPRCPICCTNEPGWTIGQHNQMSWKGNLYLFKCSCCGGIISMSMPDVTTLGNGASGIVANPTVGLTNLMVKSSSGKEVGAVYAVVESVGTSGVDRACEGKEFKLEHLQDMFLRK